MSNVRADWQPVFLWPLPADSSLPLPLPPPIPIPANPFVFPASSVFSRAAALSSLLPFFLVPLSFSRFFEESVVSREEHCYAGCCAASAPISPFPGTEDFDDLLYRTGFVEFVRNADGTHSIHFSANARFAYKVSARSRGAALQLNALRPRRASDWRVIANRSSRETCLLRVRDSSVLETVGGTLHRLRGSHIESRIVHDRADVPRTCPPLIASRNRGRADGRPFQPPTGTRVRYTFCINQCTIVTEPSADRKSSRCHVVLKR